MNVISSRTSYYSCTKRVPRSLFCQDTSAPMTRLLVMSSVPRRHAQRYVDHYALGPPLSFHPWEEVSFLTGRLERIQLLFLYGVKLSLSLFSPFKCYSSITLLPRKGLPFPLNPFFLVKSVPLVHRRCITEFRPPFLFPSTRKSAPEPPFNSLRQRFTFRI